MNTLYTILGPSGSGKTTLVNWAKERFDIPEVISHSTRGMRVNEKEGNPYYFVPKENFKNIDFIEKVEYNNNYYGLSKKEILDKLNNHSKSIVIVDKEGIKQLKNLFNNKIKVVYIYSTPGECFDRMYKSRPLEDALSRLNNSFKEEEYSNAGIADYIIRNKDLNAAKKQLEFILTL